MIAAAAVYKHSSDMISACLKRGKSDLILWEQVEKAVAEFAPSRVGDVGSSHMRGLWDESTLQKIREIERSFHTFRASHHASYTAASDI